MPIFQVSIHRKWFDGSIIKKWNLKKKKKKKNLLSEPINKFNDTVDIATGLQMTQFGGDQLVASLKNYDFF